MKTLRTITDTPCLVHMQVLRPGILLHGLWRPHARHLSHLLAPSALDAAARDAPNWLRLVTSQRCGRCRKAAAKADAAEWGEDSDAHEQDHSGTEKQESVDPPPPPRNIDAAIASLALPVRVQAPFLYVLPSLAACGDV